MASKIIPDFVRDELRYEPETGHLYWKNRLGGKKAGAIQKAAMSVTVRGVKLYNHRVAWFLAHNEQPEYIDHINPNPFDNRLCNLRSVSHKTNCRNKGARGVCFTGGRWVAYFGNRPIYQGKNILVAHCRRIMAERADHPVGLPLLQ
jgi:hypothetical protein